MESLKHLARVRAHGTSSASRAIRHRARSSRRFAKRSSAAEDDDDALTLERDDALTLARANERDVELKRFPSKSPFADENGLAKALRALRAATDAAAAARAAEWIDKTAGDSARRMEAAREAARAFIDARRTIPSDFSRQASEALASTAASRQHIGWLRELTGHTVEDGTKDFENALERVERVPGSVVAKEFAYLLVPGLFGSYYPGYYDDVQTAFTSYGVSCKTSRLISGEGVVRTNAAALKREIDDFARETSGKKVVVIGHSKGGVDAAAALAMFDDDLRDKVRGLIAVQCPYGGSPIATDLLCDALASTTTGFLEALLSASRGSGSRLVAPIADLTYAARRAFLNEFPVPKHYEVVSFHTSTMSPAAALFPSASYIRNRYGAENDGLVARVDAELPNSIAVRASFEQDHADCVFPTKHDADLFARHVIEEDESFALRRAAGFDAAGSSTPPPIGAAIVRAQRALSDALPERLRASATSVAYHEALVGVLLTRHPRDVD